MAVFLVRQPRCVFIHIPKTGGASIRHGFFRNEVDGPKQGFIPEAWEGFFKFAFVRNPYDRLVSAWKMFADGMDKSVWEHPDDCRGISLKEFLEIAMDDAIPFAGNRETTQEKIRHHAIPQTHEYNCLQFADFVGRFESIESDFRTVCQKLGIPFDGLPHWNRTPRQADYMGYFDRETLSIADEFYDRDFVELDYRKHNFV